MTNPFQNFNEAMRCVIERGGKAWRRIHRNSPERIFMFLNHYDGSTITMLYESDFDDGSSELHEHELCKDDLTATDWVWEEAS